MTSAAATDQARIRNLPLSDIRPRRFNTNLHPNFVDRGLLAVVGPDLVPDLGISDLNSACRVWVCLLYTIMGIPLAGTQIQAIVFGS